MESLQEWNLRNSCYETAARESACEQTSLWREIQRSVRLEVSDEPARTNQSGPTLAYRLWHLGLIMDLSA